MNEEGMINAGDYIIKFGNFTKEQIDYLNKENIYTPWVSKGIVIGYPYLMLKHREGYTMMADVPMEKETNQDFIDNANGHVLIGGLGFGLIILPLLEDESIKSITVVENDSGLIEVVAPILKNQDKYNKLKIINDDIFRAHERFQDGEFDTIYFDIWPHIIADNFLEMEWLNSLYINKININNNNSTIDSWCYDYCKKIFVQTMEFREYVMRKHPGKEVRIEKKRLYIDNVEVPNLIVDERYLNSKHRFSL